MRSLTMSAWLLMFFSQVTAAEPAADWKLPEADGQKWAARVTKAVSRDNWTVQLDGNEIVIERSQPVAMVRVLPNGSPDSKPIPDGERSLRFILRFGPNLTIDEYERLAAVNAKSEKERERLQRAVRLPRKFGEFLASTPEEEEQVRNLRAAVDKLPHHDLPDLYTPDHRVFLFLPGDGWSFPADEQIMLECADVEESFARLFGTYDPTAASHRRGVGKYAGKKKR